MARARQVAVRGIGMLLPGAHGPSALDQVTRIILEGATALSPTQEHAGISVAGLVDDAAVWEASPSWRRWPALPRVTALAEGALLAALRDAGLSVDDLNERRVVLLVASVQFGLNELTGLVRTVEAGDDPGLDYWLHGTPGSVASSLGVNLGLQSPTLTLTGGCSVGMRAFDVGAMLLDCGEADVVVVVGAEQPLEPVFLSSASRTGRSGFRATSPSGEPSDIRPHDAVQSGNAVGEGAVAMILERPAAPIEDWRRVRVRSEHLRSLGSSPAGLGDPATVGTAVARFLQSQGVGAEDLHHVNDFTEGGRALEDYCVDLLTVVDRHIGGLRSVPVTSQEACFGHVPGATGLIKVLASMLMLREGLVAPTCNLRRPYGRWEGWTLPHRSAHRRAARGRSALLVSTAGGGDTSCLLLEGDRSGPDQPPFP